MSIVGALKLFESTEIPLADYLDELEVLAFKKNLYTNTFSDELEICLFESAFRLKMYVLNKSNSPDFDLVISRLLYPILENCHMVQAEQVYQSLEKYLKANLTSTKECLLVMHTIVSALNRNPIILTGSHINCLTSLLISVFRIHQASSNQSGSTLLS